MADDFTQLTTPDYGNILGRQQFMDLSIKPLWLPMPPISGPAYTVQLSAGDHLMMHAAIYQAPPGSIIVVDGVDCQFAVAGGNVCAVAQQRGIKGFIVDGVIRDLVEVQQSKFPVFARGIFPVPGSKNCFHPLAQPINCGGVTVETGDIVVADIDGIAVIPQASASEVFSKAKAKADQEASMSLADWRQHHESRIEQALLKAQQ